MAKKGVKKGKPSVKRYTQVKRWIRNKERDMKRHVRALERKIARRTRSGQTNTAPMQAEIALTKEAIKRSIRSSV